MFAHKRKMKTKKNVRGRKFSFKLEKKIVGRKLLEDNRIPSYFNLHIHFNRNILKDQLTFDLLTPIFQFVE